MTKQFHLPDWPKLGRYNKGRGRPAPSPTTTLPPLPSVASPLATINPNGDSAEEILPRVQAILDHHELTSNERAHFAFWRNLLTEKCHAA